MPTIGNPIDPLKITEAKLESSLYEPSRGSVEELKMTRTQSESKREEKKMDPLTKEINKLKKDYVNAETAHKAIEEKLKKNIEDLTSESAKFKQEYEKTSEQLQNHIKKIVDMEEKDAKKAQETLALKEELKAQTDKLNTSAAELQETKSKRADCENIIEIVFLIRNFYRKERKIRL